MEIPVRDALLIIATLVTILAPALPALLATLSSQMDYVSIAAYLTVSPATRLVFVLVAVT